jgi:2-hydroxychromene-2-carboxylate isomerase
MKSVEFWFSIGSPYTYLTVMRLPKVIEKTGLEVFWHPFSARQILQENGTHPYQDKPVQTAYMWTDLARQSRKFGLSPRLPAPFPLTGYELANRVAVVAAEEGWVAPYVQETYRRWFHDGHPAGAEPNLSRTLEELGHQPGRVIAKAEGSLTGQAWEQATRRARERGVFDTPSFIVEDELYVGDDRLPDALRHAIPNPRARVMRKPSADTLQHARDRAPRPVAGPLSRHTA